MMSELGRMQASQLARSDARPTGVIGVNDLLAFGLMAGFRDAGLSVPQDVSVIGIDNVFLSTLMHPAMTSVRVPVPEMAQVMVERGDEPAGRPGHTDFGVRVSAHAGGARFGGAAARLSRLPVFSFIAQSLFFMTTVFVSHPQSKLAHYFGDRATPPCGPLRRCASTRRTRT
jgi:hypothetical protein